MKQKETFRDYYKILQVHMMAEPEMIRLAYKRLSKRHHPDNGGDDQIFGDIQEAYDILSDISKRNSYNMEWRRSQLSDNPLIKTFKGTSPYDVTFKPVLSCVAEYLFFIQNKAYDEAYRLVSEQNQQVLFKKDFLQWQTLIGEIHELMDYDCVVESFSVSKSGNRQIVDVKVKVREVNHLLNRVEEDYFIRKVIEEAGEWKILLPRTDVKAIIKKYKKLINVNKKNRIKLSQKNKRLHEEYTAKEISFPVFRNQVEYEFLRYKRYKRIFSIIRIRYLESELSLNLENRILRVLKQHTRNLDAYTKYDQNTFLVLLPETGYGDSFTVVHKLNQHLLRLEESGSKVYFHIQNYELNSSVNGVKEFLGEVLTR